MKKWTIIAGVLLIVALAALGGVAGVGYSGLSVESPKVDRVEPALDTSLVALGEAGVRLLVGDSLGAANRVVEGLDVSVTVDIRNGSSVPVYVPTTTHTLLFSGVEVSDPISVAGGLLSSGEAMTLEFEALVPKERIPQALLAGLVDGGHFQMEVMSNLKLGPFTVQERNSAFDLSLAAVVRNAIGGR